MVQRRTLNQSESLSFSQLVRKVSKVNMNLFLIATFLTFFADKITRTGKDLYFAYLALFFSMCEISKTLCIKNFFLKRTLIKLS